MTNESRVRVFRQFDAVNLVPEFVGYQKLADVCERNNLNRNEVLSFLNESGSYQSGKLMLQGLGVEV